MKMHFTKMHGIGNDFIVIDMREEEIRLSPKKLSVLAKRLCNRRFGIGADQMLLLYPSKTADFRMAILNADGSEVEMCGNGIRCFAKYIWDRNISRKDILEVETLAGIIKPEKVGEMVKVDMGMPELEGRKIPVKLDGLVKDYQIKVLDRKFRITCVSMGNPHAVIFIDDVAGFDVAKYGPIIENDKLFPKRINVEFIEVINSRTISMRVWERGAGETLACGTGASAAAVAANLNGYTGRKVKVRLLGGDLNIEIARDGHVYMTGPAEEVFEGTIENKN